ncbi:MAG: hypothetical protein O4804_21185 [Trichodesmium sp. St11_bin5]|nr:hypothetical protein [Trichodesmium sp. St11_bin5]MDT9340759.1 hypothetical protein [Trichodesmium erythraeum 21-75]
MLITGRIYNPNQALDLPVEFNKGYFEVHNNRTFIVSDGSLSMTINGLVLKAE